jgi:hypothetical protein
MEVVIPLRRSVTPQKREGKDEAESDEDDLDWGDGPGRDEDWKMEEDGRSPSPVPVLLRGSGRTGDRDVRCKS